MLVENKARLETGMLEMIRILIESEYPKKSNSRETIEEEYKEFSKDILKDIAHSIPNKENEKTYALISACYKKLLARCPLRKLEKKKSKRVAENPFNTFIQLDMTKDNLGRAMRLKPMKNPLQNDSVLKGVSYMNGFFLKRVFLLSIVRNTSPEIAHKLVYNENYLCGSDVTKNILSTLWRKAKRKAKVGTLFRRMSAPKLIFTPEILEETKASFHSSVAKSDIETFTEIKEARNQKISKHPGYESEIIKLDHSLFGLLKVTKSGIVFETKKKRISNVKYRFGSTKEMAANLTTVFSREWKFKNIKSIMIRRYNLMKQGFELFLRNNKSVFIILFDEETVCDFFGRFKRKLAKHGGKIPQDFLYEDIKQEREAADLKEKWKKNHISNFDYLMKVNNLAGRTFQDLSQYPVFPWVLKKYTEKTLTYSSRVFRNFLYPIAGISEEKRKEASKKYENTDDFPGGPFEYGQHYLPGRAVLGYLLRLQPYTYMIYKFDCGGDCPTRHFHSIEKTWQNTLEHNDMNYELIPEFFYNPEFFANQ